MRALHSVKRIVYPIVLVNRRAMINNPCLLGKNGDAAKSGGREKSLSTGRGGLVDVLA
jgi:hypothetical protein